MKIETNWYLETPNVELQQFVAKINKNKILIFLGLALNVHDYDYTPGLVGWGFRAYGSAGDYEFGKESPAE